MQLTLTFHGSVDPETVETASLVVLGSSLVQENISTFLHSSLNDIVDPFLERLTKSFNGVTDCFVVEKTTSVDGNGDISVEGGEDFGLSDESSSFTESADDESTFDPAISVLSESREGLLKVQVHLEDLGTLPKDPLTPHPIGLLKPSDDDLFAHGPPVILVQQAVEVHLLGVSPKCPDGSDL